jgi:hypothetical protein
MLTFLTLVVSQTEHCKTWAQSGECSKNPSYMWEKCDSECISAGETRKKYEERCPMVKDGGILKPNTMHRIFEEAVVNFPELKPELVSKEPPIIVFDSFVTSEEADVLVNYGLGKYTRSTGLGVSEDGTYKSITTSIRTSLNTWCQDSECTQLEDVKRITKRVSEVAQVPSNHFEYAQLLHYYSCPYETHENCSFYKRHHDSIPGDVTKNQGPRIYTMFIYLNDVEEGGLTVFDAGLSVQPKKGRAVFWPSVLSEKPFEIDSRTYHEAKPVLKGEKFGANFWIHQYDFITAHAKGCTM